MDKVLILDGNERSALAITRSLGKRGIPVVVAEEAERSLAGVSRYCHERFSYPSPIYRSNDFLKVVIEESRKRGINIIYPVTDVTTHIILKHKNKFSGIIIPFVDFEKFELLTNKISLIKLALDLNIPVPESYFINVPEDLFYVKGRLKYPVVLKPYRSRIFVNNVWLSAGVKYAYSEKELYEIIEKTQFLRYPYILQSYIEGEGKGVFAIYNEGQPVAFFAHRRIREKPPSGGVSVLCESIALDDKLLEYSRRIFDKVGWHGVAMVEYKVTKDGVPYLMEVNARFWGSLQLAIDSGIDFPWLLYKIAKGWHIDKVNGYKEGIKFRWLLGDLDNLYLILKSNAKFIIKLRSLIQFLNFFDPNTFYAVNRWDDIFPFLFELKEYFKKR